jgi:hypothetical protein
MGDFGIIKSDKTFGFATRELVIFCITPSDSSYQE